MVQDLKEIIDHLNTSNSQQDSTDPVSLALTLLANSYFLQDFLRGLEWGSIMHNDSESDCSTRGHACESQLSHNTHMEIDR